MHVYIMYGEVVITINNVITTCEMKETYHIVDTVDCEDHKNDEEYWTGSLLQVGLHHHIRVAVVYGDVCRIMQSLIEACSLLSLSHTLSSAQYQQLTHLAVVMVMKRLTNDLLKLKKYCIISS